MMRTMRTDAPQPDIEEIAPDEELLRVDETAAIMVRPDGYYWQAEGSRHDVGLPARAGRRGRLAAGERADDADEGDDEAVGGHGRPHR